MEKEIGLLCNSNEMADDNIQATQATSNYKQEFMRLINLGTGINDTKVFLIAYSIVFYTYTSCSLTTSVYTGRVFGTTHSCITL